MIGEPGCQETAIHQHGHMDISAVLRRRQECVVVTRYWAPLRSRPIVKMTRHMISRLSDVHHSAQACADRVARRSPCRRNRQTTSRRSGITKPRLFLKMKAIYSKRSQPMTERRLRPNELLCSTARLQSSVSCSLMLMFIQSFGLVLLHLARLSSQRNPEWDSKEALRLIHMHT